MKSKNPSWNVFKHGSVFCSITMACVFCIFIVSMPGKAAEALRIISWNMESDFTPNEKESDPDLLRQQMSQKRGVQLWGLSEVLNADTLAKFEQGAEAAASGADFIAVLGTTGGRDRLAILYDSSRFELLGKDEVEEVQVTSGLRAPLVAQLKEKQGGEQFLFMVNHLKRGGAQNADRLKQAQKLNQWVRQQTLPVIAVGDYNFDYDVENGDLGVPHRDGGFDALIKDSKFTWVKPQRLVKTQAADQFNTILDFVFLANTPSAWSAQSRILERSDDQAATENDFDDDENNTDHRPLEARIAFTSFPLGAPTKDALLKAIADLERELLRLRALVEQMP